MKLLKRLLMLTLLASTAAVASAQDNFVYRPNFARGPYYYYQTVPPGWDVDRFVYRENFAARRQGVRYRAPTYEEYYLNRHNELPPYGYYGQEIRHLRR